MKITTLKLNTVTTIRYMSADWIVEHEGKTYTGQATWREGDDDSGFEIFHNEPFVSDNMDEQINEALYAEYVA